LHTFDVFSEQNVYPEKVASKALNFKLEVFAALLAFLMPGLFYH